MAAGAARVERYHAASQNPAYRPPGTFGGQSDAFCLANAIWREGFGRRTTAGLDALIGGLYRLCCGSTDDHNQRNIANLSLQQGDAL